MRTIGAAARAGCPRSDQPTPLPWAVGGDAESLAVDGDMVVVPTQRGEVVEVVGAAVAVFSNMVRLKPVAALTGVDGAATVTPGHEAANRRWDGPGGV